METELKTLVEDSGFKIGMGSDECTIYKTEKGNCFGCNFEVGCSKLSTLMNISMLPMMYKATSFTDFQRITNRVSELTKMAMAAKTPKN